MMNMEGSDILQAMSSLLRLEMGAVDCLTLVLIRIATPSPYIVSVDDIS
jgi:hypothetical protein